MWYAELHAKSYCSPLGASTSPEYLAETASHLNLHALALTDRDSLGGTVRFTQAAKRAGLHGIIGGELSMEDGSQLTLLAESQVGYANLSRLTTASRMDHLPSDGEPWIGKIDPSLNWHRLAGHTDGLIALTGGMNGPVAAPLLRGDADGALKALTHLRDLFGPNNLFIELQNHNRPQDNRLIRQLSGLAYDMQLPVVATNDVHYATRDYARLYDAMIAIGKKTTLDGARRAGHLPFNHNAFLRTPEEMAYLFRERLDAIENTIRIADRCNATIDFTSKRIPHYKTPNGQSEFAYLYEWCHDALPRCYPDLQPETLTLLTYELKIIAYAGLAGYVLIVADLCRFARSRGIGYGARGAGCNSEVAYLLGISKVDPIRYGLTFDRFISPDRRTMPDFDIDFERSRRPEVIQYVYETYGPEHVGMVCNYVTYQAKSSLRDLAKVLDFPTPVIDMLAKKMDTHSASSAADDMMALVEGEEAAEVTKHPVALLSNLMKQIDGAPKYLSIHSGGMLITDAPINEVVPQEAAKMDDRIVVQWDKDSVEDAGLIKIDILSLAMLSVISSCLALIKARGGEVPDLDKLSLDDPAIYAMLQRGDTIGAFQVESRAQQQMLPRLKPVRFEDIIIAIAIIRPGPIQGGMVHPYIRRRHELEPVTYWHPKLEPVLSETLGVMLFQEQVLKTAMVLAGFTPGEADMLRRALSRARPGPEMDMLRARFISGAAKEDIDSKTADTVFTQLAGYAGYGFCKSHSAAFALVAYQSLWLKHYYPAEFCCALLNNQPVGFYSPEVLLLDAGRHGVKELRAHIRLSAFEYTVEYNEDDTASLRAGLSTIKGIGQAAYERIDAARQEKPFANLRDFLWRTKLPKALIDNLIRAGALDELGERRDLLKQVGAMGEPHDGLDLPIPLVDFEVPHLEGLTQTIWEYELMGHSPDGQIMRHYRAELREAGVRSGWEVKHEAKQGDWVWVAGMVVVRQRPQTAKGIMFLSLEDESGLLDLVIKPDVYPTVRPILQETMLIVAGGPVQKGDGGVTSVLVQRMEALV